MYRLRGVALPSEESVSLWVDQSGLLTDEPVAGAELLVDGGWILPGLVDAHCHIGLGPEGAVTLEEADAQARTDRDAGTLLLRDCGSPLDTTPLQAREDLPEIIRAGRHLARPKRYIRGVSVDLDDPGLLPEHVAEQAAAGDGWVKLVGDWIERDSGDLAPSFSAESFAQAIAVAHAHGAKVTAHCFGEAVLPGLIEGGIDCIEHGTGLSTDLVDAMVERGVALVPTVVQLDNFPGYADAAGAKYPAYAAHMRELHARRRDTIMGAYEAGVAIYAGTDAGGVLPHGGIADEVLELAAYGFKPADALGAASWHARAWLGHDGTLAEGTSADFVVVPRDPLEDLTALREPTRVVLRGAVVA